MKQAMYYVTVGTIDEGEAIDNWRSVTLMAQDAMEAGKKVRLHKKEYIAQIKLVDRVS